MYFPPSDRFAKQKGLLPGYFTTKEGRISVLEENFSQSKCEEEREDEHGKRQVPVRYHAVRPVRTA